MIYKKNKKKKPWNNALSFGFSKVYSVAKETWKACLCEATLPVSQFIYVMHVIAIDLNLIKEENKGAGKQNVGSVILSYCDNSPCMFA